MFVARVAVSCKPDQLEHVVDRLTAETSDVPAAFAGCHRFAVSIDVNDANLVHIIEEWDDAAAFETYQTSAHFAEIMGALQPCLAGPPDSSYYQAERVGP